MRSSSEHSEIPFLPALFRILSILCLVLFSLLSPSSPSAAEDSGIAAYQAKMFTGEQLHYVLKWGLVIAGHAVLEAIDNGDGTCSYKVTARSTPFIDLFYPVRIMAESRVDCASGAVLRYWKSAKEGFRRKKEREVVFNWKRRQAVTLDKGRVKRSLAIPLGTQDPLSVFFAWRAGALGNPPKANITDGKRIITGTVSMVKEERVRVPAGTFPANLLVPHLHGLAGVFSKSPDAKIEVWVRIGDKVPLLVKSKVKVGHFSAKLTRVVRKTAEAKR